MVKHCIFAPHQTALFMLTTKITPKYKKWLLALFIVVLTGGAGIWYLFTEKFTDTMEVKADFTVNAMDFIQEFKQDMAAANKKYSEKIVVVNGLVSEIDVVDTTANIKMVDTTSGAYIIFAFQRQHLNEAKQMREGDSVSIKGSCSNGVYSSILETEYIAFKRCAVNN